MIRRANCHLSRRVGRPASSPFNGNFASLFPGAFQVVQTDIGLTYGGTPLAAGTVPPAATLSGTLATVPIPILFKPSTPGVIGAGAIFSAFADGTGTTPFQVGITPAAGVPVALTGPATGLSIAWAAGTSTAGDTWTATCAGLADQSGNGNHYAQAAVGKQPKIAVGLNGHVSLLCDAVDDYLESTLVTALPYQLWAVWRVAAAGVQKTFFGPVSGGGGVIYSSTGNPATNINQFSGVAQSATMAANTYVRTLAKWTNSTADSFKIGSAAPVTGTNTGAALRGGAQIGANLTAQNSAVEFLACAWLPGAVSTVAADAAVTAFYGSTVQL